LFVGGKIPGENKRQTGVNGLLVEKTTGENYG